MKILESHEFILKVNVQLYRVITLHNNIELNCYFISNLLSKAGIAIKWSYAPIPTELSIASIERRMTTLRNIC